MMRNLVRLLGAAALAASLGASPALAQRGGYGGFHGGYGGGHGGFHGGYGGGYGGFRGGYGYGGGFRGYGGYGGYGLGRFGGYGGYYGGGYWGMATAPSSRSGSRMPIAVTDTAIPDPGAVRRHRPGVPRLG